MKYALTSAYFLLDHVRTNEPFGPRHLQMIADAGIDCIEVLMIAPHVVGPRRDSNLLYTDPVQIARMANCANKLGIEMYSVHAPYNLVHTRRGYVNLLVSEGFNRGTAMQMADADHIDDWDLTRPNNYAGIELVKGLVDITAMLGGQLIVAHIGGVHELAGQQKQALYDNLMAIVPYLEQHGVSLGLENIYADGIQMIKSIPSKYVGAVLCTHHTVTFADYPDYLIFPPTEPLVRVIHEYGDKLIHLHFNEVVQITENNIKHYQEWYEHAPARVEDLDFRNGISAHYIPYEWDSGMEWLPLLKALKDINYDRVCLFEPAHIWPEKQIEGLKLIKAGFERMAQEFASV